MFTAMDSNLHPGLTALLNGASVAYKALAWLNWIARAARRKRLDGVFVISVENISFGGTGKTPCVIAIGRALEAAGAGFAIISRGYRGEKHAQPLLVSPMQRVKDCGDEARMLADIFPGQAVIVHPNRQRAIALAQRLAKKIVILDDGFQNAHIAKDCSLMLLNPGHPYYYLRHFRCMAAHADFRAYFQAIPPAVATDATTVAYTFAITTFHHLDGRVLSSPPQGIVAFSAVGDNARFRSDLAPFGLLDFVSFPDHHPYSVADIEAVRRVAAAHGSNYIVCTEKDAVKVRGFLAGNESFIYARNSIQLGGNILERIIAHASKKGFV